MLGPAEPSTLVSINNLGTLLFERGELEGEFSITMLRAIACGKNKVLASRLLEVLRHMSISENLGESRRILENLGRISGESRPIRNLGSSRVLSGDCSGRG